MNNLKELMKDLKWYVYIFWILEILIEIWEYVL